MSGQSAQDVDIVIVGAGLVGTPLAHVLAGQGWSVALLDAQSARTVQNLSGDPLQQRCTALSLGSQQWLVKQGLWQGIADDACEIEQVHVSHKGYFGSTRLHAAEMGAQAVGYVVNNDEVTRAFQAALTDTSVLHCSEARVHSVQYQSDSVTVMAGSQTYQARLLIAADGVSSSIREAAGIDTRHVDYEQLAVLGTVQVTKTHNHIAYERFTDSGPLALLPRPGPYMSFVDCIEPDQRESLLALDDDQYRDRLQSRFGFRLGRIEAIGPRFATPLLRIEATRQVAARTVLMGNAMRLLHPVGGQGYNLALRDVAALQRALSKLKLKDAGDDAQLHDPGSDQVLNQFEVDRVQDQTRIVQLTDVLARSFRGKAVLPSHARALALIGLDTISPLRKRFAELTMGMAR